jgi:DNA-binding response OmpR family regulator
MPNPKRILIVEDEPDLLKFTAFRLKKAGYDVITISDGGKVVETVRTENPDLVLLDMNIPTVRGEEVCRTLKSDEKLKKIPVILLSASPERLKAEYERLGADGYLVKPYESEELRSIIRTHLGDSLTSMITSDPKPDKKVVVATDSEAERLVTKFFENRKGDVRLIDAALEGNDFAAIGELGHQLCGSGRIFGFDEITKIGASLEKAAGSANKSEIQKWRNALADYLSRPRAIFEPPIAKRKHVLVADDMEEIVDFIGYLLKQEGFAVETARDGEECLAKANEFRPDLVILDIMMPKINGIKVLDTLKKSAWTKSIGVIICSGKSDLADQLVAQELGAYDYLSKPFKGEDLLSKVKKYFVEHP